VIQDVSEVQILLIITLIDFILKFFWQDNKVAQLIVFILRWLERHTRFKTVLGSFIFIQSILLRWHTNKSRMTATILFVVEFFNLEIYVPVLSRGKGHHQRVLIWRIHRYRIGLICLIKDLLYVLLQVAPDVRELQAISSYVTFFAAHVALNQKKLVVSLCRGDIRLDLMKELECFGRNLPSHGEEVLSAEDQHLGEVARLYCRLTLNVGEEANLPEILVLNQIDDQGLRSLVYDGDFPSGYEEDLVAWLALHHAVIVD
jgi:hypothetical protein